jgi:hypothetical protein
VAASTLITDALVLNLAKTAQFLFDVNLHDGSDSYFISGDGVDDLDKVITIMQRGPPYATLLLDVSPIDTSFLAATLQDVQRLRIAYIATWGTVNKPDYYDEYPDTNRLVGSAFALTTLIPTPRDVALTIDIIYIFADSTIITADMDHTHEVTDVLSFAPRYGVQGYTNHDIEFGNPPGR